MNEGWVEVLLAAVFVVDNRKLGVHDTEPPVLSLSKYEGFVRSDEYFDKRIASANLHGYKTVAADAWAYSTIHIDEGSIARNGFGYTGVISPMYTTMRWVSAEHDPAYFELLLRSPGMLTRYRDSAQGTVNRRRSLSFKTFSALAVSVPPLAAQRRIVDLVAHLDGHLANLRAERDAVASAITASLDSWDAALTAAPTVPLGSLCSPRSGPSWSVTDESDAPSERSTRVLKITNTRPDGTIDLSDRTYVTGLPKSTTTLNERSIVLVRTNGNRARIGNVYRPTPEAYGFAVSAFQFSADLQSTAERDWLYWWLRAPRRQEVMSEAASGSTGLGNLAARALKGMEVSWPDQVTRDSMVSAVEALEAHGRLLVNEVNCLIKVRAGLLDQVLIGAVTVQPAYDTLLDGVA